MVANKENLREEGVGNSHLRLEGGRGILSTERPPHKQAAQRYRGPFYCRHQV